MTMTDAELRRWKADKKREGKSEKWIKEHTTIPKPITNVTKPKRITNITKPKKITNVTTPERLRDK